MPRRLLAAVAAFVLVAGQAGSALAAATAARGAAAPAASAPIQKGLLENLASGKADTFVVEFSAKADLRGAAKVKGHTARGKFVLDTLTANARKSQAAAQVLANKSGIDAKSYWLYNEMIVHGTAKQAQAFAKLKGVTAVRAVKIYPLVKPVPSKVVIQQASGDPEWGVEKIGAPGAWDEGILGQGVVVASVDTGVDFTHPALVNQYRGNNGDGSFTHDYNWWDGTGTCGGEPCDDVGHGTHTMGTMVGGDGPGPFTPDVGVAPGARWIAAKGCQPDGCPEDALLSSGQFILAPTDLNGENPDPSLRPDIVNNSWGGGPGDPFYLATVQAWRAAGIIPIFSSGNPGPFCGEGGSPGDFLEVFSSGATDINDQIADFSGRGPSAFGKVNPDVVAPGVNVTSSVPGGGYEAFDGTSMAAPHVSGTIALILSGKPALLGDPNNYQAVTNAVRVTAINHVDTTCGGDEDGDPNNVYGDGRIDAKAAVDLVASGGTLSGTITDVDTNAVIGGATVTASDGEREFSAVSDASGNYSLFLAAGSYVVTATAFGYAPQIASGVTIVKDQTTDQDFQLDALPRFTVSGHVRASEDGSPIPDAQVRALGTPVPPATTDAAGAYSLELPIGDYTLRAAAGGCTEQGEADISLVDHNITQDFALFRKLDDFGHGCRPIPFAWVDAGNQTALYGDEFVGRLHLPFDFDFYGETYSQVWIADNGYVNFLGPDQFNFFPSVIPSPAPPNAAIYAFWQDLAVDATSQIDYATVGTAPNRAFILEFTSMQVLGSSAHVSYEMKLWEDGRIDLLYGNNPANPGDGRSAGIGIENAAGDDALQFSFLQGLLDPNSAYRFEHVPSGLVSGVVTDANDGEPIAGATITASPGGRTTHTDGDGAYTLRLRPGAYTLEASAENYVTASSQVTVVDEGDATRNFVLKASVASVDPTEVSATVDFGQTKDVNVTLSNSGTGPLTWEARERDQGATAPELPPAPTAIRKATWGPQRPPAGFPKTIIHDTTPGPGATPTLSTIITDPAGDSLDSNDVTTVRAGSDGSTIASIAIDFAPTTPMAQVGGYMYLDTDQDPSTGVPAEGFFGKPTQDVGMEFFVDLFLANSDGIVFLVDAESFDIVAELPASVEDHTIAFDVPLEALGGDDGFINTAMVVGQNAPSDWAPDAGHGTIEPFTDAPWLSETPESGTIDPGDSQVVTLHLGTPTTRPGEYHALVVFVTNAPKQTQVPVDVTLTVTLPPEFGVVTGTVTDAHSEEPLGGVAVDAHTTWKGAPLTLSTTTADDGTYSIVGPAGTWPTDYTLDGYVPLTKNVTIVKGVTTSGADAAIHKDQPHAQLDGAPVTFILTPGRTSNVTRTLSNEGGHEPLTFSIGEVDLDAGTHAVAPAAASRHLPAAKNSKARTTFGLTGRKSLKAPPAIHANGDVLASWNAGMTLPWGVGYTGDLFLSDPVDLLTAHFTTAGDRIGDFPNPTNGQWGGDMAFDAGRGLIWQVNVGGDNGLYGIDPSDGSVVQVVTGAPWSSTSQRGVAYDGASDVFYVGGWNEGIVYRVAGPSWPTPGETLSQCNPADPNISGLAWNGSFGMLWEATNSDTDAIFLIDPATCETVRAIDHPDGGGFGGAGIELDVIGNIWTVGQNSGNAYLIESGLPTFSDVPWLSVAPTSGTVAKDGSTNLTITANTTGMTPGVYHAIVVVQTNDPDNSIMQVPVVLVVPHYQQGVNAGGNAYMDPITGDLYATDRAFSAGGFGYVGGQSRSSSGAIGGTERDPLYQDLRTGMSAYRFAVPNGVYKVDLAFAELQAKKAGARVFSVSLEGSAVISNLDVFAAAGGQRIAYDRTFIVEVTDGVLDIGFIAQRGDQPIVNGILVTELPPGSPGN